MKFKKKVNFQLLEVKISKNWTFSIEICDLSEWIRHFGSRLSTFHIDKKSKFWGEGDKEGQERKDGKSPPKSTHFASPPPSFSLPVQLTIRTSHRHHNNARPTNGQRPSLGGPSLQSLPLPAHFIVSLPHHSLWSLVSLLSPLKSLAFSLILCHTPPTL
ncbi:hypothetical protein GPALN_006934 [Globodera pallida]|nr:hypothetical protein GPALN_006934 [Globodera pallida]